MPLGPNRRIYDRLGRPISAKRWGELARRPEYRLLAVTRVEEVEVKTLWTGIDFSLETDPPQIFESQVFWGDDRHALSIQRYPTEAAALAGHDQLLAAVRDTIIGPKEAS